MLTGQLHAHKALFLTTPMARKEHSIDIRPTHSFFELDLVDFDSTHTMFEVSVERELVSIINLLHLWKFCQHSRFT